MPLTKKDLQEFSEVIGFVNGELKKADAILASYFNSRKHSAEEMQQIANGLDLKISSAMKSLELVLRIIDLTKPGSS